MTDQISREQAKDLKEDVIIIRQEMERLLDRLVDVVTEMDEQVYYEAYLVDQIRENIYKNNQCNTDLGDLIKALLNIELGHDEGCSCRECSEGSS